MSPSTTKTKQLGKTIRASREARGLSLRDVSDKVGIAHSYLSLIENGERAPALDTLNKIARALRVPVEDFLAKTGSTPTPALPDFAPYLRAKFELSESAIRSLQTKFDELLDQSRKGTSGKGGRRAKRPR